MNTPIMKNNRKLVIVILPSFIECFELANYILASRKIIKKEGVC